MSSKVSDDLLLVATFIPLAELSPEDLAAERAALEGAGFSFPQADDTFDIQPGGPYIAAWNPLHTVLLTGPARAVGRNPTAVLKNVMAVIKTAVEAQKNNKLFQDLFSKDKTLSDNVSSSQVVFTPSSNAAGSTKVQAYVCLPSDHSLRAFLAALTLLSSAASLQDLEGCPRADDDDATPLLHGVVAEAADIGFRLAAEESFSSPALLRLRSHPESTPCPRGCGADARNHTSVPATAATRAVLGQAGITLLEKGILAMLAARGLDPKHMYVDKKWTYVPAVSQAHLTVPENAPLLAARHQLLGLRASSSNWPAQDCGPQPVGPPYSRCLLAGVPHSQPRFVQSCGTCLLPGHSASRCPGGGNLFYILSGLGDGRRRRSAGDEKDSSAAKRKPMSAASATTP